MKEVNVVPLIFLNLFKASGLKCFDEENEEIRKTLSVYIGSFMKIRGYREWSGLLSYLSTRLNLDDIQSIRNTFQFFSIVVKESDIEFLSIDDNILHLLVGKLKQVLQGHIKEGLLEGLSLIKKLLGKVDLFSLYPELFDNICTIHEKFKEDSTILEKALEFWLKIFKKIDQSIILKELNYFLILFQHSLNKTDVNSYSLNLKTCEIYYYIFIETDMYKREIIHNENLFEIFRTYYPSFLLSLISKLGLEFDREEMTVHEEYENESDPPNLNISVRKYCMVLLQFFSGAISEMTYKNTIGVIEECLNSNNKYEREKGLIIIACIAEGCHKFLSVDLVNLFLFLIHINEKESSYVVKSQAICTLSTLHTDIISLKENIEAYRRYLDMLIGSIGNAENLKYHYIICSTIKGVITKHYERKTSLDVVNDMSYNYLKENLSLIIQKTLNVLNDESANSKILFPCVELLEYILYNFPNEIKQDPGSTDALINTTVRFTLIMDCDFVNYPYYLQLIPLLFDFRLDYFIHNDYISQIYSKITSIFETNYYHFRHNKPILDEVLMSTIANVLIAMIKYLNNINEISRIPNHERNLNNEAIYQNLINYGRLHKSVFHKYFQYVGEISKVPELQILQKKEKEISSSIIEELVSITMNKDNTDSIENTLTSNIIYSYGNLIFNYPQFHRYFEEIVHLLRQLVISNRVLNEDIALSFVLTFGKIGLFNPLLIFNNFELCFNSYLIIIKKAEVNTEVELSLKGIFNAISCNPYECIIYFPTLSESFLSILGLPVDLHVDYRKLVQFYSEEHSEIFQIVWEKMNPNLQNKIKGILSV